ncbi:hypothetical protein COLO4_17339 [Corchorus olitorius]|uniref:Uncharacterized protein n=1 Tax=Corchorus olitorius TaxID=93759 RepID=A0A1R3JD41_9ROSI|nr:hypothetical protein COLO4_17339 [Corchorus olitorius]
MGKVGVAKLNLKALFSRLDSRRKQGGNMVKSSKLCHNTEMVGGCEWTRMCHPPTVTP